MPGLGSISRRASTPVTTPTGRLMKKIQCQLIRSVSTPPESRPIDPPAEATNPYTPSAFACSPRLREHRHDHAEDHGVGQRAADALDEARGDQHLLRLRHRAQGGGGGEDRQADQEDAPLPDQVARAPGEQQQPAERDQVGVDHPGQVARCKAEVVLDRGERDVHDRRVEHDHQRAGAEHVQRCPAVSVCLRGGHARMTRLSPETHRVRFVQDARARLKAWPN